ncbi:MAG: hypothetical protein IKU43_07105 [Clostridia bacterium]|nr:hypothetical protein [Clostridia bacterium]
MYYLNIKDGRDTETDYSSVLIGTIAEETDDGNLELYAVCSVVEMGKNKPPALIEYGVVGSLYAANAKKTADIDHDWFDDAMSPRPVRRLRKVSISQLLRSVKEVFDDTLYEDVYEHFEVNIFDGRAWARLFSFFGRRKGEEEKQKKD